MSNLSQFAVSRATKSITNAYSSGGAGAPAGLVGGRSILSGALTANTFKTLLNVTGAGQFTVLTAAAQDATSRGVGLRVTLDGVVVFSSVCTVNVNQSGNIAVGSFITSSTTVSPAHPIRFNRSALVEVSSTLTETDKIALNYILLGE